MERYYYLSDNLDELEVVEDELERAGIATEQIHVLSHDDRELAQRKLHSVTSIMKKDLVRSTTIGAVVGLCLAVVVLLVAWLTGWPETYTWIPFIFLAVVVLGFCSWEGGLWGIQEPNKHFARFHKELDQGNHLLFVDIDKHQGEILEAVCRSHPRLKSVGSGAPAPKVVVMGQQLFNRYRRWGP